MQGETLGCIYIHDQPWLEKYSHGPLTRERNRFKELVFRQRSVFLPFCVCVCVSVLERERERERV